MLVYWGANTTGTFEADKLALLDELLEVRVPSKVDDLPCLMSTSTSIASLASGHLLCWVCAPSCLAVFHLHRLLPLRV